MYPRPTAAVSVCLVRGGAGRRTEISNSQPAEVAQRAGAGHQHGDDQQQRDGRRPGGNRGLPADDHERVDPVLADGFDSEQEEAPDATYVSSSCFQSP